MRQSPLRSQAQAQTGALADAPADALAEAPAAAPISGEAPPAGSLQILVRRILGGGEGRETLQLRVYCPDRGASIPLDECARCARCQGFSLDSSRRRSFLLCRGAARPASAPGRAATMPLAADATPLSAIMSREVVCVTRDLSVEALTALLLHRGFSGAPVVDEAGRPIGMVSKTDLVRRLHEHAVVPPCRGMCIETEDGRRYDLGPGVRADWLESTTVGDIMMPIIFTLPEDAPVSRAAALMAAEGVHRLAVVDRAGALVGVLAALDVVRWVAGVRPAADGEGSGEVRA